MNAPTQLDLFTDLPPTVSAPSVMLVGDIGTGKTHSLRTLLECGLEVFAILTEPNSMDVLADTPKDQFHWHYVGPKTSTIKGMLEVANKINTMTYEDLCKLKAGINKQEHRQWMQVLQQLTTFECQRTGKTYEDPKGGDVYLTWGPDKALVLDSQSGLAIMARGLQVGARTVMNPGEWGSAMNNIEDFTNLLTSTTRCVFVTTAHPEPERDETTGSVRYGPSTLGSKLGPKLPRFFSDCIKCMRDPAGKHIWSTMDPNWLLKAVNVPWAPALDPSFVPLMQEWKRKVLAGETPTDNIPAEASNL